MNNSNPLVTCGLTTYNAEKTIAYSIESIKNQSYNNLELLIVDDKSTDRTIEIIKDLNLSNYFKTTLISNQVNKGVAYGRNLIIQKSSGDFIIFFDDDDYSYKYRVESQIKKIIEFENKISPNSQKNNSPLCYTNRNIIFRNKKLICKSIIIDDLSKYRDKYIGALLSADNFPINGRSGSSATCTLCARKSTFEKILFNNELRRCEDLEFAIRALQQDICLISTDTILVDQFYTKTLDKKDWRIYEFKVLEIHKDWLLKNNLYEFALLYLKLKNSFLYLDLRTFTKIFFVLITKYPLKVSLKLLSALNTFTFTIKSRLNELFNF
mgnify:CR=1 FL=1